MSTNIEHIFMGSLTACIPSFAKCPNLMSLVYWESFFIHITIKLFQHYCWKCYSFCSAFPRQISESYMCGSTNKIYLILLRLYIYRVCIYKTYTSFDNASQFLDKALENTPFVFFVMFPQPPNISSQAYTDQYSTKHSRRQPLKVTRCLFLYCSLSVQHFPWYSVHGFCCLPSASV